MLNSMVQVLGKISLVPSSYCQKMCSYLITLLKNCSWCNINRTIDLMGILSVAQLMMLCVELNFWWFGRCVAEEKDTEELLSWHSLQFHEWAVFILNICKNLYSSFSMIYWHAISSLYLFYFYQHRLLIFSCQQQYWLT